jgi:hypothetical protein
LIGDIDKAIENDACPNDSTIGIGDLFHVFYNLQFSYAIKEKYSEEKDKQVEYDDLEITIQNCKKVKYTVPD